MIRTDRCRMLRRSPRVYAFCYSLFNRLTVRLEKVTLIMGCLLILKLVAPVKDKASLSFFKVQNSNYLS